MRVSEKIAVIAFNVALAATAALAVYRGYAVYMDAGVRILYGFPWGFCWQPFDTPYTARGFLESGNPYYNLLCWSVLLAFFYRFYSRKSRVIYYGMLLLPAVGAAANLLLRWDARLETQMILLISMVGLFGFDVAGGIGWLRGVLRRRKARIHVEEGR